MASKEIRPIDEYPVRRQWDEELQKWWFSIVDVVAILSEQESARSASTYWAVLKKRLKSEGANQLLTDCKQLKMKAADGKMRLTDVADTEQILRLIQSIPSPKAEPFKMWLAAVGSQELDETVDPELSIEKAIYNYRRLGYSESWINQRIKSIEVRKMLTDEWDKSGVKQGAEFAFLTDLMSKTWSGMSTREYKDYKDLKKENLRDHMTNTELVLNMSAEVAATDISVAKQPEGFDESAVVAEEGAMAAKVAREQIESSTGKQVVSQKNAKHLQGGDEPKRLE